MAKEIICPACNSSEKIVRGMPPTNFETRGKWKGYPALKCKKCKTGLYMAHPFLHLFMGIGKKLKVIPLEDWEEMKRIWKQEFGEK